MKTKNFTIFVLFLSLMLFSLRSYGVPYPDRIQWNASPNGFITSLYQGVLGRAPENQQVVNAWASNLHSRNLTKLQIFWRFVNSNEYQRSRWAKQRREYTLYFKYVGANRNSAKYYVSKNGSDHRHSGPYTFGIAMALRKYHQLKSRGTSTNKNNGINLLGVPVR